MSIECCCGCVAPKRYPGCHAVCPEYIKERAEYDRRKAIHDREQRVDIAIYVGRNEKVYKAFKNRRNKKV